MNASMPPMNPGGPKRLQYVPIASTTASRASDTTRTCTDSPTASRASMGSGR